MRIFFTIWTFLIFISCSTTKNLPIQQVIGTYQWNGIYGVGATIKLEADHTFEYHWQGGLMQGTTIGTWKSEGSTIILNSNLQPPEKGIETFEIIKIEKNNTDSLSIKVVGPDSEYLPFATCVLQQDTITKTGASTNFLGEAILPKLDADSLIISHVDFKTIRLKLEDSVSAYAFKMKDKKDFYVYFTDETWKFKRGRLFSNLEIIYIRKHH